jgi:hypothetical protein
MSTPSQTPAFRIKAIKVKSPDPRSVLALLPPEIKKPKVVFKTAVIATPQVAPVELEVAAVPQIAIPEVSVESKYLPDANSILAILPVEEDELQIEHFGATSKNTDANVPVQERAATGEFEVIPTQEVSFPEIQTTEIQTTEIQTSETQTSAIETAEVVAQEAGKPEAGTLESAVLASATTETEISSLPAIGKPNVFDVASKIGRWIKGHVKIQANRKRLRVCESVSLGEKRFIAVVQLDGKEFLVGGAPNSLSLLANVGKNANASFAEVLNESYEQVRNQG